MCGILKIQQTSECNTKKQALREHTGSYQWGEKEEEGHYRGRGLRGYTAKHKEFSQDFFNNHEWSIPFKNRESLSLHTCKSYNIVHQLYFHKK